MSAVNPPAWAQGRTDHPAVLFRVAQSALLHGNMTTAATVGVGGVHLQYGGGMAITGLASMNVAVATGICVIPSTTAWNGSYTCYNTASFNDSIAASSATQWRTDRVDAVVTDPGDNTAAWNVIVTTGTFSSSAPGTTPAAPNNSIPLALVRVVPNMTVTNGGGTVVDNRNYLPFNGPWPTTSSNKPVGGTAADGTMWYEKDTNLLGVLVNGTQKYITTGVPYSQTATSSYINGWSGTATFWKHDDGWVDCMGIINTPYGTDNTQLLNSIPAGYQPGTSDVSWPTTFYLTNPPAVTPWMRATGSALEIHNTAAVGSSIAMRWQGRYLATA